MANHLLTCSCGKQIVVQPQQAGETKTCECGLEMAVPALRELKQLPESLDQAPQRKPWRLEQGITFAAGSLIIFVALICLVIFLKEWMLLDTTDTGDRELQFGYRQIDSFRYVDGYKFWLRLKLTGIGQKFLPDYVKAQRRAKVLESYMVICGLATVFGGLVAVVSLFLSRKPKVRTASAARPEAQPKT